MRVEKEQMVRDIGDLLNETDYIYLISYKGLSVESFSAFRTELDKHDSQCHVLKNRLIVKAAELHGPERLKGIDLSGDTAVITGKGDPGAVAKLITTFAKTNDQVGPKAGLLDDELLSGGDVRAIADLPSREVLLSQLVGVIQAPTRNLVNVLYIKLSGVVNVLNAYKNKLEEENK